MSLSKDLRDYFGNPVTVKGEGIDVNACVLKTTGLTDYDLAKDYDKVVTARVDGEWVGWGSTYGFIHYYCNSGKHNKTIEDVTYWGNEGCRNHLSLQYCLQNKEVDELINDDLLTKEEYKHWIGYRYGKKLPRVSTPLFITCKNLSKETKYINFN